MRRGLDAVDERKYWLSWRQLGDLLVEQRLHGGESQVAAWTPLVMAWTW
jgi:hypothetical protein